MISLKHCNQMLRCQVSRNRLESAGSPTNQFMSQQKKLSPRRLKSRTST